MKPSQILKNISELNDTDLDLFFIGLDNGFRNEWDCDLEKGLRDFSGIEIRLAAKNGAKVAEHREKD